MKTFIFALMLSVSAVAAERNVQCRMIDQAYRHQFEINFSFDDEAVEFENKEFNFTFKLNERDAQTTEETLTRSGTITKIAGGVLAKNDTWILTSVEKDAEYTYVNLVVDFPQNLTSTIRMKDGMTYVSSCKSL